MNYFKLLFAAILCFGLFFGTPCKLTAQIASATITGNVTTLEDGQTAPIFSATVVLEGTTTGAITDFDGNYTIPNVKPGTYNLLFTFVGLDTAMVFIEVKPGEKLTINQELKQNNILMQAVNVKAKADRESSTILMLDRKEAELLTENIGAKELAAKGVSNAVDGLAKVSGISVQGGKHFFVRGMGDRYNNALLNGMPIASPDPDKKVIPLDIFSSDIIQSLSVFKSFSGNLYGDFAGGTVNIKTKDFPDKPTLTLGLGLNMNTQTTFKEFMTYDKGKNSYLGFAKGSRQVPNELAEIASYNSRGNTEMAFPTNNNTEYITAPLGNSYDLKYGNFFAHGNNNNRGLGVLIAASYGNNYSFKNGTYRLANKQGVVRTDYNYDSYTYNTNSSVLANLTYKFNNHHQINLNTLFLNLSSDNARDAEGYHFDYASQVSSRRFTYKQNQLANYQLSGTHQLLNNQRLEFNWAQVYNLATSQEPDRRQFVFLALEEGYHFNSIDVNENHRFYNALEEQELSSKAALAYKVLTYDDEEKTARLKIKAGFNYKDKGRNFDYRQFNYNLKKFQSAADGTGAFDRDKMDDLINASTHADQLWYFDEKDDLSSAHEANLNVKAAYLSVDFDIVPKRLKVLADARYETALQEMIYKSQNGSVNAPPIVQAINSNNLMPALSFKFTPSDKNVWWLTTSKTISRPGFKETAPFEYLEFFAGERLIGNPELQNGTNYNVDMRYEFYPNRSELISVGVFGKYLENPIEQVNIAASSGRLLSFTNIANATIAGLELEVRKQLNFLKLNQNNQFTLGLNATCLYSQVSIADDTQILGTAVTVTNKKRALQGASPFLINADLNYQFQNNKHKTNVSLVYNVYGKRIKAVGIKAPESDTGLEDVYEMPAHSLDLVVRSKFNNRLGVGFNIKNLLNPTFISQQKTDDGIIELNNYQRGMNIGLSLSYDVF